MPYIERYSFVGDYSIHGKQGTQQGAVSLMDEWLLFGRVTDYQGDIPTSEKDVLGMRFPEDGLVAFIKIPQDEGLTPVIWFANPVGNIDDNDPLSGRYEGFWLSAENMPPINLLQAMQIQGRDPITLEDVAGMDRMDLERLAFSREISDFYRADCEKCGQIGSFSISHI